MRGFTVIIIVVYVYYVLVYILPIHHLNRLIIWARNGFYLLRRRLGLKLNDGIAAAFMDCFKGIYIWDIFVYVQNLITWASVYCLGGKKQLSVRRALQCIL